jgi:hypothetical protein
VRNLPAALYKALGGFATNGVNMTKLESYMVDGEFSATQFYADVDGHPEDKGLAFALEELKFFSREFRIVGVYPGHLPATFTGRDCASPWEQGPCTKLGCLAGGDTPVDITRRAPFRRDDHVIAAAFFAQPKRIREQTVRLLARVVVVHRVMIINSSGLAGRDHRLQLRHDGRRAADEQRERLRMHRRRARRRCNDRPAASSTLGSGRYWPRSRRRRLRSIEEASCSASASVSAANGCDSENACGVARQPDGLKWSR